ncbi:hypothetical protein Q3G72_027418 [Acer saccharum]|nr:hypothetical protein Q3G72_027418 [Acer saccharum]
MNWSRSDLLVREDRRYDLLQREGDLISSNEEEIFDNLPHDLRRLSIYSYPLEKVDSTRGADHLRDLRKFWRTSSKISSREKREGMVEFESVVGGGWWLGFVVAAD